MTAATALAQLLRSHANEPWMTIGARPFAAEAAALLDSLSQRLAAAERERDGYMASAELHYKIRCDQEQNSSNLADQLASAERERDEARAEIDRLVLCYSDLMHSHDHWKSQATEQASSAERRNAELARRVAELESVAESARRVVEHHDWDANLLDTPINRLARDLRIASQEPPTS